MLRKYHAAPFAGADWFPQVKHSRPTPRRRAWHFCLRCGHGWLGRNEFKGDSGAPKRCPGCRSPLWNRDRV